MIHQHVLTLLGYGEAELVVASRNHQYRVRVAALECSEGAGCTRVYTIASASVARRNSDVHAKCGVR